MFDIKPFIRSIPDFPKPGILFRDISPLLSNAAAFRSAVDDMAHAWDGKVDAIAALDARGFVFGSPLAYAMGLPLAMVRKRGKLPGECHAKSYGLEYGEDTFELQRDAFKPGARVLLVDDLLATGGSALAAADLVAQSGASVVGCAFAIELVGLEGRARLAEYPIHVLASY